MKTFKEYLEQNDFDDMFSDTLEKIKKRGKAVKTQLKTEPYTLTLFHGSKADINSLDKQGSNFILDPNKSEQGLIWFTHEFIKGYNPFEYAKGHGDWVLTYPLETKKHFNEVQYEDGTIEQKAPNEIMDKMDTTKNSRFLCSFGSMFSGGHCIELPEGWYFTYKHEKFIGTDDKVYFSPDMISSKDIQLNDQL